MVDKQQANIKRFTKVYIYKLIAGKLTNTKKLKNKALDMLYLKDIAYL
jgi:hypothetical protein